MSLIRTSLSCLFIVSCSCALEISMSGEKDTNDGVYAFAIDVIDGTTYTVHHRFNDFKVLKEALGEEADSLPDAPFPPKFWLPWPTQTMIDGRRKALETWLKQCLLHEKKDMAWGEHLQEFLKEGAEIGTHGKDALFKMVKTINDGVYEKASATSDQLSQWYEDGVKNCEQSENCKLSMEKWASAKETIAGMTAKIGEKVNEMKESVLAATAAEKDYENAVTELEELKHAEAKPEAIQEAEEKVHVTEEKAVEAAKHVEEVKHDVEELEASAKTAMEESFVTAVEKGDEL